METGPPQVDAAVAAGEDGSGGGLLRVHQGGEGRGNDAEMGAQIAPVGFAKVLAKDGAGTGGGREVAAEGGEEGGLAGTVGPEQDPVLTFGDLPRDVLEDSDAPAEDSQLAEGKNGGRGQGA